MTSKPKNRAAVALGRRGGRAPKVSKCTAAQRSEHARHAALMRWAAWRERWAVAAVVELDKQLSDEVDSLVERTSS